MPKHSSITIVVAAYNEEASIAEAVQAVVSAVEPRFESYEVLVMDDGSTDRTGEIADALSAANPNVRAVHNEQNIGFGLSCRRGIDLASKEYIGWFPGDNDMEGRSLADLCDRIGDADIVVGVMSNLNCRSLPRQLLSRTFTGLMNTLFGLKFRYYNGPPIYRVALLRKTPLRSAGYAMLAELLIRSVKNGATAIQLPTYHRQREHGESKAFRWSNIVSVGQTVLILVWDIHVVRRMESAVRLWRRAVRVWS